MKTTTARFSGFRFGAAAVLAGSALLSAPAVRAAEGASRVMLANPVAPVSTPADPAESIRVLIAPALLATDPDVAILGANALRCAPTFAAFEQMDRVISERVAQSRDSFIAAQAGRDLRTLESTLGVRVAFQVASAQ